MLSEFEPGLTVFLFMLALGIFYKFCMRYKRPKRYKNTNKSLYLNINLQITSTNYLFKKKKELFNNR